MPFNAHRPAREDSRALVSLFPSPPASYNRDTATAKRLPFPGAGVHLDALTLTGPDATISQASESLVAVVIQQRARRVVHPREEHPSSLLVLAHSRLRLFRRGHTAAGRPQPSGALPDVTNIRSGAERFPGVFHEEHEV